MGGAATGIAACSPSAHSAVRLASEVATTGSVGCGLWLREANQTCRFTRGILYQVITLIFIITFNNSLLLQSFFAMKRLSENSLLVHSGKQSLMFQKIDFGVTSGSTVAEARAGSHRRCLGDSQQDTEAETKTVET